MPTATRPHMSMKTSHSFNSVASSTKHHIKLAPSINSATVISFEKRVDQKIWYMIRIQPQLQLYSAHQARSYVISRKYEDFTLLSQSLHDRFSSSKHRAGSRLPPKIKSRLNLLPASKHIHIQRAEEINQFLSVLFQSQSMITESYLVLEFFGIQISDTQEKGNENTTSRWKRLRCSSFLARSPSLSSPTALSSLCSQAANKIMPSWHRTTPQPQPSMSTPMPTLRKSKSSYELENSIKIKVIYDVDNIIVIQVPRSITLRELRSRIAQKFSDSSKVHIQDNVVLLFNDSMSSCCSVTSQHLALPAVLINKEQELSHIMQTKWIRLEKVTLRCIHTP